MKTFINTKSIKNYISSHNLSKSAFAKECGISLATLNRILNSQNVNVRSFIKVADRMKVSVDDLINKKAYSNDRLNS